MHGVGVRMRYRKLGNTGLVVSEVGFGTIPILRGSVPVLPAYYNLTEIQALQVMEHAFEIGCNLFDTAIVPEYGDAERKLGLFAAQKRREQLIISDKCRFFTGNEMYEAVLKSCETLGTYVDLYFVHQVDQENEELVFGKYGALDAFIQLKGEGKIRFAGVASHYYDILLRGAKDNRVDVLQGSGNILERGSLDRLEQESAFSEKGFLLNKVYAAGILPSFFEIRCLLNGVLSYPVSCALVGIGTKDQADQAMRTQFSYKRLTFLQVLSALERYFDPIPCDRCQRCSCVYGTEIHTVFRQYNYYFLGKDYWALRKLDMGIRESAEFCRICTDMSCIKFCPKNIRIPDRIQEIDCLVRNHWK